MPRASRKGSEENFQIGLFQLSEVPNSYRKPAQIIHSKPRSSMSLLQRKLTNAWLKNAVDTPPDADGWWTISTMKMSKDIDFDSNNVRYMRESALQLMRIVFEWDVLSDVTQRVRWKASVLFPEVEFLSGVIRYQISSQLRDRVLSPDIYALIDLNVIREFSRGSSLAIYEHCLRFEKVRFTTPMQWEEFRDMVLGESADAASYREFRFFKSKVLRPCIAEINTKSDITVTLHQAYNGRKVSTLQFEVVKKPSTEVHAPDDERFLELIGEMVTLGLPQSEAKRLAKTNTFEQLSGALAYTKKRVGSKRGKVVDNPAAYFRSALVKGWGDVIDADEKTKPSSKSTSLASEDTMEAQFALHRYKEAEKYFNELDAPDQDLAIQKYNGQQPTASLQIKPNKPARAAKAAFFQWLATETWGEATTEELLDFAKTLLFGGKGKK